MYVYFNDKKIKDRKLWFKQLRTKVDGPAKSIFSYHLNTIIGGEAKNSYTSSRYTIHQSPVPAWNSLRASALQKKSYSGPNFDVNVVACCHDDAILRQAEAMSDSKAPVTNQTPTTREVCPRGAARGATRGTITSVPFTTMVAAAAAALGEVMTVTLTVATVTKIATTMVITLRAST